MNSELLQLLASGAVPGTRTDWSSGPYEMPRSVFQQLVDSGLASDETVEWPVAHFEGGGDTSDAGAGPSDTGPSDAGPGPGFSEGFTDSGTIGGNADVDGAPAGSGQGEFSGVDAAAAAQAAAPAAPSMSQAEVDAALAEASAAANAANQASLGLGGMIATNGMTRADLAALQSMGLGNMDISETQTVDQALASMAAHSALNSNLSTLAGLVAPGFGQAVAIAQGLQGLASGQISLGQTAVNTAISMVAQNLGVPASVVSGVVNGNPGQAVSGATAAAITGAMANALGVPANVVGALGAVSGVTGSLSSGLASEINSALGVDTSGQSNTSALASAIDSMAGTIGGAGSSLGAGTSAADAAGATAGGGDASTGTTAGSTTTPTSTATSSAASDPLGSIAMLSALGVLGDQGDAPKVAQVTPANVKSFEQLGYGSLFGGDLQFSDGGEIDPADMDALIRALRG